MRWLYLGTDPRHCMLEGEVIHFPLIEVVFRNKDEPHIEEAKRRWESFTHVIFASKHGVESFFSLVECSLENKSVLSVGKVTSAALLKRGVTRLETARDESQEGIVEMLEEVRSGTFLLPGSSGARPLLREYLAKRGFSFFVCPLYDTVETGVSLPDLGAFDGVVITSPSCARAFFRCKTVLHNRLRVIVQGEVTKKVVAKLWPKEVELVRD